MMVKATVVKNEYKFFGICDRIYTSPKETYYFKWDGWYNHEDDDNEEKETLEGFITRKLNESLHLPQYCSGAKDRIKIKIDPKTKTCILTLCENDVGRNRWEDRVHYREYGTCTYVIE